MIRITCQLRSFVLWKWTQLLIPILAENWTTSVVRDLWLCLSLHFLSTIIILYLHYLYGLCSHCPSCWGVLQFNNNNIKQKLFPTQAVDNYNTFSSSSAMINVRGESLPHFVSIKVYAIQWQKTTWIAYYAKKIHMPQDWLGYIFRKVIQKRSFKGRYWSRWCYKARQSIPIRDYTRYKWWVKVISTSKRSNKSRYMRIT